MNRKILFEKYGNEILYEKEASQKCENNAN